MNKVHRRGFLGFLAAAPVAAPAIIADAQQIAVTIPPCAAQSAINAARSRAVELANSRMIVEFSPLSAGMREQITREYIRESLFTPYVKQS